MGVSSPEGTLQKVHRHGNVLSRSGTHSPHTKLYTTSPILYPTQQAIMKFFRGIFHPRVQTSAIQSAPDESFVLQSCILISHVQNVPCSLGPDRQSTINSRQCSIPFPASVYLLQQACTFSIDRQLLLLNIFVQLSGGSRLDVDSLAILLSCSPGRSSPPSVPSATSIGTNKALKERSFSYPDRAVILSILQAVRKSCSFFNPTCPSFVTFQSCFSFVSLTLLL